MSKMQLPSRVVDVLAALKTQGYDMEFTLMACGNIVVDVYKDHTYRTKFFLVEDKGFDMYNSDYTEMCKFLDPKVKKRRAAVLKYLEGIIEY